MISAYWLILICPFCAFIGLACSAIISAGSYADVHQENLLLKAEKDRLREALKEINLECENFLKRREK